ncbi:MAG: zinc-ribbon domain containing protein [Candidatus Gracilibacteria bacterium]
MADFEDQKLACGDCNGEFTFTASEQAFYADKGFSAPKRCPTCRDKKKQERRSNMKFTKVTCAQCGVETEVPFVPRNNRPVLCRDCFAKSKTV